MSAEGGFAGRQGPGRVSIVGAGQVGTMLGMALMGAGPDAGVTEVTVFDRDPAVAQASIRRGSAHRAHDRVDEALDADAVILAMPVQAILSFLEELAGGLRSRSLLIDTGSAKVPVVRAMRRTVPPTVHALGGHPMTGTEVPGPEGAAPELCRGAPFALVPVRDDPEALARGADLVSAIGATPVLVDAETHDRTVARTSHLPHVVAFAMAMVARNAFVRGTAMPALTSTGLAGATRLARSDPRMVAGFVCANASHVRESVVELTRALSELTDAIEDGPERLAEVLAGARSPSEDVA